MNPQALWTHVDHYLDGCLLPRDSALEAAQRASDAAGLPAIQVAPNQGALLQLLALAVRAQRVLEIGTLGGYSTIWLARALPAGGRLLSLELDPGHADVARANLAAAGVADRVEVRVGAALELLPALEDEPPFDFVFVDADKAASADYLEWALRLTRPGSLIVVDNVVREGDILDELSDDAAVRGVRRLLERVGGEPRLVATALQTVGCKGHDGLLVALVTARAQPSVEPD